MKFPIRIHRRWLRRVALGLTVAAVVAPSAQAYDYHQPFGPGRQVASLPCMPGCSFDPEPQASVQAALEKAHPRGGLVAAGSVPTEPAGRSLEPATTVAELPLSPFSHFSRHPANSLGGPANSTGDTTVDGPSIAAGIGMGAVFALMLAGLAAVVGRQRGGLTHA